MKCAEELLFGELAIALNIPKDDVKSYIEYSLKKLEQSESIWEGDFMDLLNKEVYHSVFGKGIITKLQDSIILIDFKTYGEKKFIYPDAFENYLKLCDSDVAHEVADVLTSRDEKIEEEKRLKKKIQDEKVQQEKVLLVAMKKKTKKKK